MGIAKYFGEILIAEGTCKQEEIERALAIQSEYGGRIGSILLNLGILTEEKLIDTLALQLGLLRVTKEAIADYEKVTIPQIDDNFFN